MVTLHFFFDRTLLGRAMRAVASDREAARLMGIDVGRIVMLSFALAAAVGAIGGLIVTPVTLTIYDAGTMLGLKGADRVGFQLAAYGEVGCPAKKIFLIINRSIIVFWGLLQVKISYVKGFTSTFGIRRLYWATTGSDSSGTSPPRIRPTSKEVPPTSVQMMFGSA